MRSEFAQIIYEKPINPKNKYLEKSPGKHADYRREVIDKQITLMQKRGIWKKPAHSPGWCWTKSSLGPCKAARFCPILFDAVVRPGMSG